MAYNRQWLRENALSYIHDKSLTSEAEVWVDLALKEVSRVLRCREMNQLQTVDLSTQPIQESWIIPADCIEVVGVFLDGRPLDPLTERQAGDRQDFSGDPIAHFSGGGKFVTTVPSSGSTIVVSYLQEVTLPQDDSESPAVTAYPGLFLDAVKAQAYDFKEDTERQSYFEQRWYQKAVEMRREYEMERHGGPMAMEAS